MTLRDFRRAREQHGVVVAAFRSAPMLTALVQLGQHVWPMRSILDHLRGQIHVMPF